MTAILILTIVCVLTYSVEITFGLAGTILMLPVMRYFFDEKTLVIYSVLPQIVVAAVGLWRSPRTVKVAFISPMLAFAAVGMLVGLSLFFVVPGPTFRLLLGVGIVLAGIFLIGSPARFRVNPYLARGMDMLAGVSQGFFGISGPIAMTRLLGTFEDKTEVRNYALAFFLVLNMVRAISYALEGSLTWPIVEMMLYSAPVLIVTLWFANHLHFRVQEENFRRGVAWLITLGGISLLAGC